MWSKQQTVAEPPAVSPSQGSAAPVVPFNSASNSYLGGTSARSSARLGASIVIKVSSPAPKPCRLTARSTVPFRCKARTDGRSHRSSQF